MPNLLFLKKGQILKLSSVALSGLRHKETFNPKSANHD